MNVAPTCQRHLRHATSCLQRQGHAACLELPLRPRKAQRTYGTAPSKIAGITAQEIEGARAYCSNLLRHHDTPSHTLTPFIPAPAQTAHLALRALNIDVARIADTTSTPTVGSLRMQFWRDCISKSLAGRPPKEPVAIMLACAAAELAEQTGGASRLSKAWLTRVVNARERRLTNPPYRDLAHLEAYAEDTYSTLLYLTLSAVPVASVTADHVASHIGKAQGIAAVLRGLPFLAFPAPPASHSPQNALGGALPGSGRQGTVTLPLDVMAEFGVREEAVFREGGAAQGLRDAVFKVATRANDHLITAREMVRNLREGRDVGHEFEHMDEVEHSHAPETEPDARSTSSDADTKHHNQNHTITRAFGVYMPAVSTQLWLDRLQACDFDVFDPRLRKGEWRLPWRAYWAFRGKVF